MYDPVREANVNPTKWSHVVLNGTNVVTVVYGFGIFKSLLYESHVHVSPTLKLKAWLKF